MKTFLIIVNLFIFPWALAQEKNDNLPKPINPKDQKSPDFPGGIASFNKIAQSNFNSKNVKCDQGIISAKVNFAIDAQGNLVDVKAIGPNESLNKEAVRAVESVKEKWTPGSSNQENIKSYFSLPFRLSCD